MSLLKKLAGETAIYGVSSILSRLLNYVILTPFLTRTFLKGEYGVVSEMYTYAALLMVLFTYRFETAFFRFGSKKADSEKVFSTASISLIVSTLVFLGLLWVYAPNLASALGYPENTEYVRWFALLIAFDTLAAIPFARLRLQNRPIRFAVIKTGGILLNIAFIYFFLEGYPWMVAMGWLGADTVYDTTQRIGFVFLSNMLASGLVLLALLPLYRNIKMIFDWSLWKKMIWYSLPLIVAGIAAVINNLIGIPMLKNLLPGTVAENTAMAGLYGASIKLAVLMSLFTQAFNYAAEPFFFRQAAESQDRKIYAQAGQAFALVGSVVFLGILLYIDIIQLFLGKDFRSGLQVVAPLLMANLFLGLFYNFAIWYKLADKTIVGGYIGVCGAVITIVANLLLIPILGYEAPAWAALACYSFMALTTWWLGQKHYPIDYPIKRIISYIVMAVVLYKFSELARAFLNENLILILLVNTLILAAYAGGVAYLEQDFVRKVLARRKG